MQGRHAKKYVNKQKWRFNPPFMHLFHTSVQKIIEIDTHIQSWWILEQFERKKERKKERRKEGKKEGKKERTKERKNKRTKERKNERTKERKKERTYTKEILSQWWYLTLLSTRSLTPWSSIPTLLIPSSQTTKSTSCNIQMIHVLSQTAHPHASISSESTLPTSGCCGQAWEPRCQSVTASPLGALLAKL